MRVEDTPGAKTSFLVKDKRGCLKSNFDQKLVRIFAEVRHWEKFQGDMKFVIPYVAHDISNQQDKLQLVRQHVLQVVREYNAILESLGKDERKLFQEHIRRLDRRISPGFSKLNWTARDVTDWYVVVRLTLFCCGPFTHNHHHHICSVGLSESHVATAKI